MSKIVELNLKFTARVNEVAVEACRFPYPEGDRDRSQHLRDYQLTERRTMSYRRIRVISFSRCGEGRICQRGDARRDL